MKKQIDIVVPFYNPSEHIFHQLRENISALKNENQIKNFSIILVNDGSFKGDFRNQIEKLCSDFPNEITYLSLEKNKGKGGAIKEGIKKSEAEIVVFYDIDFPFGREALYGVIEHLENTENDICIAKRDHTYNDKLPLKRKIISQIVKKTIYILSKRKIKDSQAGLKAMKKSVVPIILKTECNSFIMDFEFLLKALKKGKKIGEIMVTPNENIEFTDFSNRTIYKEIKNLLKVVFGG